MLLIAIARGSTAGGTIFGAIALIAGPEKTRATPCSAARGKSSGSVSPSVQVNQPSVAAIVRSIMLEKIATLRRSNLSAAQPATGVSTASGMNWTRPSKPSWNDASLIDMP